MNTGIKGRDWQHKFNKTDKPRPFLSIYECVCTRACGCRYVNYVRRPKVIDPTCFWHGKKTT